MVAAGTAAGAIPAGAAVPDGAGPIGTAGITGIVTGDSLRRAAKAARLRYRQRCGATFTVASAAVEPGHEQGSARMIIVTGDLIADAAVFEDLRRISLEHVHRSRAEPGCLHHSVQVDCENSSRLVFFEIWADSAALKQHFSVPASREFSRAAAKLASAPPTLQIYEASETNARAILA
jgi:quinol monooxygenase YgiN